MPEIENISVTDANLLLSMGVPQGLLDSAAFDAKDCAILYQRLRISMSRFLQYPLKINCLGQLLLLTGRLELITPELMTSVLSFVDNWGARASHYAAWSGNKDMLEWIKKQAPQLLEIKNQYGGTIAHYAARSGNKEMLEWIKNQAPRLLEIKTKNGQTIAHYAAWSGDKDMLEWIKNQAPQLLEIKTKKGQTIAHYAAISGNTHLFNWSLSLSKTTDFEILSSVGEQYLKEISQTLLSALSTNNFSLTEVTLPPQVDQNTSAAITVKLSENEAIKKMLPKLERVIMGYYQQESPFSTLPSELLYEIFRKMFPASTLEAKITVVYKILMNNLCPANMEQKRLLLTNYKNNMTQLIEAELERLELSKEPIFWGLVEGSLSKINAYQEIKNVLSRDYNSLDEMKANFRIAYQKARPILHHQRNMIHSFFNSTHIPKSQRALEKIANILNVQPRTSAVPSV